MDPIIENNGKECTITFENRWVRVTKDPLSVTVSIGEGEPFTKEYPPEYSYEELIEFYKTFPGDRKYVPTAQELVALDYEVGGQNSHNGFGTPIYDLMSGMITPEMREYIKKNPIKGCTPREYKG